jgi:uncharacterized protein
MSDTSAAPRSPEQRHALLDALRGFALLGILLMNIEFFSRPLQDFMSGMDDASGPAGVAAWAVYVFVQGEFWVLFSLLFGMGFALLQTRLAASDRPFTALYLRRTLALAVFGLLHIVLLWPGDILLAYAITALCLLPFAQVKGKALWISGVGLYLLVALSWVLMGWSMGYMPAEARVDVEAYMVEEAAKGIEAARIYATGSYLQISALRGQDYFGYMFEQMLMFQVPMALGVFLLGGWLLRSGRITRAAEHRGFWVSLLLSGAAIGGVLANASLGIGSHFDPLTGFDRALLAAGVMALANLPLALAYLAAFVLLFNTRLGARCLSLLAPAGRMALSNYLLQSLVCGLLFYGYGLGWYGEVDRWQQVQIALVIFATQLLLSPLWLRSFNYGPMEAVWRGLTYGRWPAMRRTRVLLPG